MTSLESCYELDFSKINFLERKIRINHPKTIIHGPPKTGKSYLIYDYLSNFKSDDYIYIDLNDFRNKNDEIINFLESFIKEKKIKVLVLENFDFSFEIPNCDSVIISTSKQIKIKGFNSLYIYGLDFEEYLLHDFKHQNETTSFNFFLKYGNLPELISLDENKKIYRLQEILKIYVKDNTELEVLKLLLTSVDEKKSINQLFTSLKKQIKISKDRFYSLCKFYEENRLIFFVQKYKHEKSTKKLYAYNHAFLNSLSHNKKFKNEFTNMIFLQIKKEYKNIYYLDKADFYIQDTKTLILSIPFFNNFLGSSIVKKLHSTIDDLDIKHVNIITVGNSDQFKYKKTEINITPFYEWALQ